MILNFALALLSSALLVLLFPPYSFAWLAPLALAPLMVACAREDRWRWRFALGYVSGFAYWFGLTWWIHETLTQYAGIGSAGSWALFALMCLAKALQTGVFAVLCGPLFLSWMAVPGTAALWVVVEYTHAWTGFEWLNLGNAGSDMTVPLRLASITGVWGVSFVFALMSAGLACVFLRRPRLHLVWLLLLPCLYLLPDLPEPERGTSAAILVQPNIDGDTVWSVEMKAQTLERLRAVSLSPVLRLSADADLIIWPEMPAPFSVNDAEFLGVVAGVARESGAAVLTGVVARAADGAPLNSALLTGPGGRVLSRYDKVNLVPFGEFVPWPLGALTKKVSSESGDFEAGLDVVVSRLGSHSIGTFICYESVFPGYVRRFVAGGAEVLINISNDGWYGKSPARAQHLQIVRMRAAENQRWILRGTNNGVTAVIDPAGRLISAAKEYQELGARFPFRYRSGLTNYSRFGDWFVALCGLLAATGIWEINRRQVAD